MCMTNKLIQSAKCKGVSSWEDMQNYFLTGSIVYFYFISVTFWVGGRVDQNKLTIHEK